MPQPRYTFSRRARVLCLLGVTVALLVVPPIAVGCAGISPGAAGALEAADVIACGALSLVPVLGGVLGAACTGEEAAVKAALDHAAGLGADAGVAVAVAENHAASALGAPLHRRRRGRRHQVGSCPGTFTEAQRAAAQAHLDARADGGA